jgi:hypothetical protein
MLLVATMAIALFGVGCGGGGSGSSTDAGSGAGSPIATSSLSKAQFVEKADEVCNDGSEELGSRIPSLQEKKGGPTQEEVLTKALVPAYQIMADKLHELGAPSGDEEKVEAYLAALQKAIDAVKEKHPSSFPEGEVFFRHSNELARSYGIKSCDVG